MEILHLVSTQSNRLSPYKFTIALLLLLETFLVICCSSVLLYAMKSVSNTQTEPGDCSQKSVYPTAKQQHFILTQQNPGK